MKNFHVKFSIVLGLHCLLIVSLCRAQEPMAVAGSLPAETAAKIDAAAADVLKATGVPSASVAVVQGGKVAYVRAYGKARLDPPMDATPSMRYSVGSVSKQFTAAALLLLVEAGELRVC